MIGAVVGGSSSLRMEQARRSAELQAQQGRRVVVLHGMAETFSIAGKTPALLSSSLEGGRPMDIVAEYCASEPGLESAARGFSSAVHSFEGCGVANDNNQTYWLANQMTGVEHFFCASVALAERGERSLGMIMTNCIEDLRTRASSASNHGDCERPEWFSKLSKGLQESIESLYMNKICSTTMVHFSTLAPLVSALRRSSPDEWTEPFVSNRKGEHLSIYLPDFDDSVLFPLLRLCEKNGAFFVLPELHRWKEKDRRRLGYFLQSSSGSLDAIWTSVCVPSYQGYESNWEIFGKSSSSDVVFLFRGKLNQNGGEREIRLKELRYETPSSLDERSAFLRTDFGWSLIQCEEIDKKNCIVIRSRSCNLEDDYRRIFEENLGKEQVEDPKKEPETTKKERLETRLEEKISVKEGTEVIQWDGVSTVKKSARLVENNIKFLEALSGETGCICRVGNEILKLKGVSPSSDTVCLTLFISNPGEGERMILLYEQLWESLHLGSTASSIPEVQAFLPLSTCSRILDNEGGLTVRAFMLGEEVRFIFPGCTALPEEVLDGVPVVFGTWREPRKVFEVQKLLKVRIPDELPSDFYEIEHTLLSTELVDVLALGRSLNPVSRGAVREMMSEDTFLWRPESVLGFENLRSEFDEAVCQAADEFLSDKDLCRRLAGIKPNTLVSLNLGDLAGEDLLFSQRLSAVYCDTLPPDYRESLEALRLGEPFRKTFDNVFVSTLMNLGERIDDGEIHF